MIMTRSRNSSRAGSPARRGGSPVRRGGSPVRRGGDDNDRSLSPSIHIRKSRGSLRMQTPSANAKSDSSGSPKAAADKVQMSDLPRQWS